MTPFPVDSEVTEAPDPKPASPFTRSIITGQKKKKRPQARVPLSRFESPSSPQGQGSKQALNPLRSWTWTRYSRVPTTASKTDPTSSPTPNSNLLRKEPEHRFDDVLGMFPRKKGTADIFTAAPSSYRFQSARSHAASRLSFAPRIPILKTRKLKLTEAHGTAVQ